MEGQRARRAKLNIIFSLLSQVVLLICGLIVPRMMLTAFGSEAYGAVNSIAHFLAYITLVEGGIGGVARAALYGPLSREDYGEINSILGEIKHFFRVVAYVFVGYALIIACSFQAISHLYSFDWGFVFALVLVSGISIFAEYYIGVTYSVFLQAAQRAYVTQILSIAATIANTAAIVVLISLGCNLLIVKFASALVFFLKPLVLWRYVKKHYAVAPSKERSREALSQKWSGLGQHLAFFLHTNTDVVVLTLLVNLKAVAVYTVYNMIVSKIQSLVASSTSGMEAVFGDMLSRREDANLARTFSMYETIASVAGLILFGTTTVMIVPFIRIYTAGVTDANYIEPAFALVLTLAGLLYCLRQPYHSVVIAAGHFKQTSAAAYGEAALNIGLSIALVFRFGLLGVAVGTVAATLFRLLYYVVYLSKHIMYRSLPLACRRFAVNAVSFAGIIAAGTLITRAVSMPGYVRWACASAIVALAAAVIVLGMNFLFYRTELRSIGRKLRKER